MVCFNVLQLAYLVLLAQKVFCRYNKLHFQHRKVLSLKLKKVANS